MAACDGQTVTDDFPPTPDAKLRTPSNLRLRMIASVGMIAVAVVALYAGGFVFWLLAVVAALFMMAEWSALHGADATTKRTAQFALSVPLAIMAPMAAGPHFFVLGLIGGAFFFIAIVKRDAGLAFGAIYAGLPVFALLLIREQADGLVLTLWTLSLVWATDIGAFFTGRTLGGPKLAPAISPAKTWSGLIGGVILATLVAFALHVGEGLPFRLVIATPLLGVLAQGGDLYESWIKRRAGVKDSGNVLPGHGGVLDRLDGLVPVAPVAALLVILPRLLA
jgi:phosphatidate cytidylyltransferase